RPAGDHAIAPREVTRLRADPQRKLRDDGAARGHDARGEPRVLPRIEAVEGRAEDRHGAAAARQGPFVRSRVDAPSEARDDGETGGGQIPGERVRAGSSQ